MFCEDQDIGTLVSNVKTENEDIRNSLHHSLVKIADGRGLSVQIMMADNLDLLYTDLNIKLRHRDCLSHFGVRMMIGMVMRTSSRDQKMTELQDRWKASILAVLLRIRRRTAGRV